VGKEELKHRNPYCNNNRNAFGLIFN